MLKRTCLAALLLAALIAISPAAWAQTPAGTIERQKGAATRTGGSLPAALAIGAEVYAGDVIRTGAGARLIIRFADNSALTLGERAEMTIDEMVYAPANAAAPGRQALHMAVGVFRYTSGAVGKARRDQVLFATPVATIGIRGTEFVGGELTVGMPPGQPHYGFQIKEGAIEVTSPLGSVTLDEPGEGTFLPLTGAAAPTPVRQWTAEEAAEAEALLAFR